MNVSEISKVGEAAPRNFRVRHMIKAVATGGIMPIGYMPDGGLVGDEIPTGFLLCDGSMHRCDDYPELYAVLGDTYGNRKTKQFRHPRTLLDWVLRRPGMLDEIVNTAYVPGCFCVPDLRAAFGGAE